MRIFARKTEAVRVEFDEAQAFVEEHHRQGAVSQRNVTSVGLRFGGELVAVAQFCYPRTEAMRRKYTTELLRMAFRSDVRVVGGASKLVEFYKREYRPTDIFTYQDATGELTDVYEKAGFTLVSQAKKKQYLVAPGKTLETASRREALGMAYATRYGPDRILGTKLGEVLRADGSRKTNAEIFIEDLGWHMEETAGDRVYAWFNPNVTFYTYKITAADSDKYYYGVSHVKKADATFEDCLNDGYFGSGAPSEANEFQNWRAKHAKTLSKEVLATFDAKAPAFEHERELVGDSWRDDPKCLNSCAGGRRGAPRREYGKLATLKECSIHGLTLHRKRYCVKCVAARVYSTKVCEVHGEGTFVGDSCKRCVIEATWSMKICPHHGLTKHMGDSCRKCSTQKTVSLKECQVHGRVNHQGEKCTKCLADEKFSIRPCPIHGEVAHNGDTCVTCAVNSSWSTEECSIHGLTRHQNGRCSRCRNASTVSLKQCDLHGLAKHRGSTCYLCGSKKKWVVMACEKHGEVEHRKNNCVKCVQEGRKVPTKAADGQQE